MRRRVLCGVTAGLVAAAVSVPSVAFAGETWTFGNNSTLKVGAGIRMSTRGVDGETDSNLETTRLYVDGQITKTIGFTFNPDLGFNAEGNIDRLRTYDAIVRLEFAEYFNIWAGRLALPYDRSNLAGHYYLGTWDFTLANNLPFYVAGRDQGATIWGDVADGRLKYHVGAYQGCNGDASCATGSNANDNLLYVGRIGYAFWDKEPGYYVAGDYLGTKQILSVGLAMTYQADATGTAANPGDYRAINFDVLMQKTIWTGGTVSVEGAYYHHDTDGQPTPLLDGDGYHILASYLFPEKVGIGQFQPVVRYQHLSRDDAGTDISKWEVGTNYIIKGHNARLAAMYSSTDYEDDPTLGTVDAYVLGLQLQY